MKKILASILTLAMLISCMVVPITAADSDVESYITEDEYGFVNAMGSTYGYEYSRIVGSVLTRGQVCRVLTYFGNFKHGGTPKEYEALFHDLSTDDYYYPYIKACYDGGIVSGYPDGTFRSAEPMATKDVARLIAYCIGYKEYINVAGLDAVLNKTDIMDGVPVTDAATQDMVYKMMYNAYHAPACVPGSVSSSGDVEFSVSEDYLGMEHLEKVRNGRGIVDGAVGTTLESPDESMIDGIIRIDGVTYEYDGNSTDFLGYQVDFYYKTSLSNKTDGNKIIYIVKTKNNKEFTISDTDLGGFNNLTYTYYKGNKAETVEINEGTDVILNGIANPTYLDADMIPLYGSVTLIDNDKKTAGYEVVKIDSYEFYLVDNVDMNKNIIYDQSEDVAALNMEEADVINIKWDGADYPMDRIIFGTFLRVKRTNPKSGYYVVDIEVLKNEKNSVTVLSANEDVVNENGGVSHKLWQNISQESKDALKAGKIVTLYFSDGIVVRVEGSKADDMLYGYLMNVGAEGVISKTVSFRIMQPNTTAVSYEMGKNVKIDGESISNAATVMDRLYNSVTAGDNIVYDKEGKVDTAKSFFARDEEAPYAQLIKYKLNSENKVVAIDTLADGVNEKEDSKLTLFEPTQARFYKDTAFGNLYVNGEQHIAGFAAGAARFMVPKTGRNEEDNYKVFDLVDAGTYTFQIADVDDEVYMAKVGCVFVEDKDSAEFTRYIKPAIVKTMEVTLDENEEEQVTVECIYQKTTKTYVGKPEKFAGVDVGDVIRVIEDKYGKADAVEITFDVSEYVPRANRIADFNKGGSTKAPMFTGYRVVYGTALSIKDGYLRFTYSTVDDQEYDFDPNYGADNMTVASGANYWKYTNNRGVITVDKASSSDIVTYAQNPDYPSKIISAYDHNGGGHNWVYILEVKED